jgi:2-C-methyl-D-erythritol 4-phosphate cytidylyltransferase
MSRPEAAAIIVAAGQSRRMGGTDKIFASLGGKPVVSWSLLAFESCPAIKRIVLVLSSANLQRGKKLVGSLGLTKITGVCLGGERRQDSVRAGLNQVRGSEWVAIHDGARPFVTGWLIKDGLKAACETGAAVAAVPSRDTVKLANQDMVERTLDRNRIWLAQTPQVFRYDILKRAYQTDTGEVTDDAALVEMLGINVKLYSGDYMNVKITTVEDLDIARIHARQLVRESD